MKTSCSVTADARRPRGPRAVSLFGGSSPPGPSVLPWGSPWSTQRAELSNFLLNGNLLNLHRWPPQWMGL